VWRRKLIEQDCKGSDGGRKEMREREREKFIDNQIDD
jgi:hypothetical protein